MLKSRRITASNCGVSMYDEEGYWSNADKHNNAVSYWNQNRPSQGGGYTCGNAGTNTSKKKRRR